MIPAWNATGLLKMEQYTSIPKAEQANILSAYWMMMRELEEQAYDSKRVLDRLQVEGFYRLWNRVSGENKKPRWMTV